MESIISQEGNETTTSFIKYIVISLATIIAYTGFGHAALILTIPPGYASISWPSAGIALGVLLIFGNRYWPSVLIASFLTNIAISYDASSTDAIIRSYAIASCIGIGAALQALLGSYLIKGYINYPTALYEIKDILKFTVLSAAFSTTVNATFSNVAMLLLHVISMTELPKSWIIWWLGDASGVLIFTPILHIFFGKPRSAWRSRLTIIIPILTLMMIIYVIFFNYYLNYQKIEARDKFFTTTSQIYFKLNNQLQTALNTQFAMQGFFNASLLVTRDEFKIFAQKLLTKRARIEAVAWIPFVTKNELPSYINWAKKDGYEKFTITQAQNDNIIPDTKRETYYPIFYIYPQINNVSALGFNLGSNTKCLNTLKKVIKTRSSQATEALNLSPQFKNKTLIALFSPLYNPNSPFELASSKKNKIMSYISSFYDLKNIMNYILLSDRNSIIRELVLNNEINVTLTDVTHNTKKFMLYGKATPSYINNKVATILKQLTWSRLINFGHRKWLLSTSPSESFLPILLPTEIQITLTILTILIGLFTILLLLISGQSIRINENVSKRTSKLKMLLVQRQKTLDTIKIGIININANGIVTYINKTAEKITGYQKNELIGKDLHEMIHNTYQNGKKFPKNLCVIHSSLYLDESIENEIDTIFTKNRESISIKYSKIPLIYKKKVNGAVIYFRPLEETF